MPPAERYRRYAAECVRVAQQIENPSDKALLLRMAQMWQQLAERAETKQSPDPERGD